MADKKIEHSPLKGGQIEFALNKIAKKNPKANIKYLEQIPAYAIKTDSKTVCFLWLLFEEKALRICGAVSLNNEVALTQDVLKYLIKKAREAEKKEIYFSTSRAGMIKLAEKSGFFVSEVFLMAEV